MFLFSSHFSCSAFHSKSASTYSYHLLCFCLCKHIHSHAHYFLKWMKASWQHVTTNPVVVPIVGAQYCWMRTIKKTNKHGFTLRQNGWRATASQKSLAVILLSECCDAVLFSTPQGTKKQCTPNNTFSQSEVESPSLNPNKTESESKARKTHSGRFLA